jgi:uncharacterized protein (TIRG00374 family)
MTLRAVLRVGVAVALSCVSVYLVGRAIDISQTLTALRGANWLGIGFVVSLVWIDIALRALRWRTLLSPIAPLSSAAALGHLLVGYLANNVLPARLGELVRAVSLADREGVSRSAVVGSILIERLMDVAMLAVAVMFGLVLVGPSTLLVVGAASGLLVGVAGLGALAILGGHVSRTRWLDRFPAGRFRSIAHGLHNGVIVVRRPNVVLQSLVLTAAAWATTAVAFLLAAEAIGLGLRFEQAFVFAAAVNLATAIPAGPGYIGTYELAAVSVSAVLGIPPAAGLAVGVIVHVGTLVVTTLGGLVAAGVLHVALSIVTERPGQSNVLAVASETEQLAPDQ